MWRGSGASTEGGAKNKFALLMGCRSVVCLPRLWRASIAVIQLMSRSAKEDATRISSSRIRTGMSGSA